MYFSLINARPALLYLNIRTSSNVVYCAGVLESIERCTGYRYMTEMMLKTVLNSYHPNIVYHDFCLYSELYCLANQKMCFFQIRKILPKNSKNIQEND